MIILFLLVHYMIYYQAKNPDDMQHLQVIYRQLVISLKFHHSQTISQLPEDLALQAMHEVWLACQKGS